MGLLPYAKDLFTLTSISTLFIVGLVVALKSGVVSVRRDRTHQLWKNVSQLVVALGGCLAFFLMIQQLVGIK